MTTIRTHADTGIVAQNGAARPHSSGFAATDVMRVAAGPPRRVVDRFASTRCTDQSSGDVVVDCTAPDGCARYIGVRMDQATTDSQDSDTLRGLARSAYTLIQDRLATGHARYPVRFWNFIPHLLAPATRAMNRYMAFNLGRQDILNPWLAQLNGGAAVAASGVGHPHNGPLEVYALALDRCGAAVENPRQIPAWQYSARFGPRPPLFARATWIQSGLFGAQPRLLISGTASVVGEDSQHRGDLDRQIAETVNNLSHLFAAAGGEPQPESWRVYVTDASMIDRVVDRLRAAFGPTPIEWTVTNLCRDDLMVEVEGIAVATTATGAADGPAHEPHHG